MGIANFDFSDETAIVTGGSAGIGRAIALGFGEAGATVVNADVRAEPKDRNADAAAGDTETPTRSSPTRPTVGASTSPPTSPTWRRSNPWSRRPASSAAST